MPLLMLKTQKDLAQAAFFVAGVGKLFEKFKIQGYEPAYDKLKDQLAAWGEFVKSEVLPRSRQDFRLPPELYAFRLEEIGIDIPPAELAAKAHVAFAEIQAQMQVVAAQVAIDKGLPSPDYREVIKALKKEQLVGDAILTHYQSRLEQIEEIIRDKQILTLPARPARIRIATKAESAATPAPNMHPPRLLGNTGEVGEFVLPLNVPDKAGKMQKFDDFNFAAASWTLTAHEARPGHELQFASVIEHGVSDARATFAFNSTNVEGWGLYSEWLIVGPISEMKSISINKTAARLLAGEGGVRSARTPTSLGTLGKARSQIEPGIWRGKAWNGRAGQAFARLESGVVDRATANSSPRTATGHKQDDQTAKTKPPAGSCSRILDQSLGSTRARSSRNRPLE